MNTHDHKPGGRSLVEQPVDALHGSGPGPGKRTLVENLLPGSGASAPIAAASAGRLPPAGQSRIDALSVPRSGYNAMSPPREPNLPDPLQAGAPTVPPPAAHSVQDERASFEHAARGPASPLPYRAEMERAFGADLSDVRTVTGRGSQLAPLGARAAASGSTVVFADSAPARDVVAHELAHVVQARGSTATGGGVAPVGSAAEQEADLAATRVMLGERVTISAMPGGAIQLTRKGTSEQPLTRNDIKRWLATFTIPGYVLDETGMREDSAGHGSGNVQGVAVDLFEPHGEKQQQLFAKLHDSMPTLYVSQHADLTTLGAADVLHALTSLAKQVGGMPGPPGLGASAAHTDPAGHHANVVDAAATTTTTATPGDPVLDDCHFNFDHDPSAGERQSEEVNQLIAKLKQCINHANWNKVLRPALYSRYAEPILQHADPARRGQQATPGDHQPSTWNMTGVGALTVIDPFVKEIKQVQQSWPDLEEEDRPEALLAVCNMALASIGVPEMGFSVNTLEAHGAFNASFWILRFREKTMKPDTLGESEAAGLADILLHETRHCEQNFRAARYLAGQGQQPKAIQEQLGIPKRVAKSAYENPLREDQGTQQELSEARMWADEHSMKSSAYTENTKTGEKLREKVNELKSQRWEAEDKLSALETSPTQEDIKEAIVAGQRLHEVIQEVIKMYSAYRTIPNEIDAHHVGVVTGQRFRTLPQLVDETG